MCELSGRQRSWKLTGKRGGVLCRGRGPADTESWLPSEFCANRVAGMLVDAQGEAIANMLVSASGDVGIGADNTDGSGAFEIAVPMPGDYILSTSVGNCKIYWRAGGASRNLDGASLVKVTTGDVAGLRFQVPDNPCIEISGRVGYLGGGSIVNVRVSVLTEDTWSVKSANTDDEGEFTFGIAEPGAYHLRVTIDGCTLYYREGRATESYADRALIMVDNRSVTGVRFELGNGQCASKIVGRLSDADGNPLADMWVSALPENGRLSSIRTNSDGSFGVAVPESGLFRVSARVDGCSVYYGSDGATVSHMEATQVRVSDSDVTGITLQLAQGMCVHRISGKLLNADGSPRSSQWVNAGGDAGSAGASTAADGSFSFAVPASGSYRCLYTSTGVGSIADATCRQRTGTAPARLLSPIPTSLASCSACLRTWRLSATDIALSTAPR